MPTTAAPHLIPYSAGTDAIETIDETSQAAAERIAELFNETNESIAATLARWETIAEATSTYSDATGGGGAWVLCHGGQLVFEGTATGPTPPAVVSFNPDHYAIDGYDLRLRLSGVATSNGTAPFPISMSFRELLASGGGPDEQVIHPGTGICGVSLAPGVNDADNDDGGHVAAPAAGVFVFTATFAGPPAGAAGTLVAQLQIGYLPVP